ncbi:sensor histidine kinase [Nocardioides pantholopis]|uniref:sensor histidine kinase n=1 Tax=Nocardioides pantholopis TaxID=2483798 RepID=UPI0013DE2D06|nr:HAMP domain-containing sensor histidine kinase [Nocardioides pantholopis]
MARLTHPPGAWGHPSTLVVAVVLLAPIAVLAALVPGLRDPERLAAAGALVYATVCLASSVFLYLHWRLTGAETTAWLSAATALVGCHGLSVTALEEGAGSTDLAAYLVASALLVGVLLVAIFRFLAARQDTHHVDPFVLGLGTGLLVTTLHVVVGSRDVPAGLSGAGTLVAAVGMLGCGVLGAAVLARAATLPRWVLPRFQGAAVGFCAAQALALLAEDGAPASGATHLAELAVGFGAALLVTTGSLALLAQAIRDDRMLTVGLRARLTALEAASSADRERLHEVKGTIAGIGTALELFSSEEAVPAEQRPSLARMAAREAGRLDRLLQGGLPPRPTVVDLDTVLEPVVLRHRTQGADVRWEPSGLVACAVADTLAEAVNILLVNAATHAPGAAVEVRCGLAPGWVTIRVSDSGPGVPERLHGRIFARGVRGPDSPGSGIGLHLARRLLAEVGGRLSHDPLPEGACFVISLRDPRGDAHATPG